MHWLSQQPARLVTATAAQLSAAGYGIHWPDIDEDLSTEGLLRGAPTAASLEQCSHAS